METATAVPHNPNSYEEELPYLVPEMSLRSKATMIRQRFSQEYQTAFRKFGSSMAALFIKQALVVYKIRFKEYWRDLGYDSFESWLAAPEQNSTSTEGNLQAQVIDLCVMFFKIPVVDPITKNAPLYYVGIKKWTLITPMIAGLKLDVLAYDERIKKHQAKVHSIDDDEWRWQLHQLEETRESFWWDCRDKVYAWIEKARTTSYSSLLDELGEHAGWDILYSDSVNVKTLKACQSVPELLRLLGVFDKDDGYQLRVSVKGRKVKSK